MTTAPDEVVSRVKSYVEHTVSKGQESIREAVQKGHEQLFGLLDGMSEAQATFKPGPDDWCVLEVLQHVVTAKRGIARLCVTLARGETPRGIGGEGEDEEQDGVMRDRFGSLADARSAAETAHHELLAFVDSLSPETHLEAHYAHFLFGALNSREWAAFQRVHDADHTNQIQKIKDAPGFPAG